MNLVSLAFKNIKKSIKDYSIYFITLVIAVAIFYLFNSIDGQTAMLSLNESTMTMVKSLVTILGYVSIFVSVVLGFLIVYANNFIIKRRKKEIGVYLTLGMSNLQVSTVLVLETVLVGIISLVVGLLIGIGLSQLLSIFTAKLFEADMSSFALVFSSNALFNTVLNFAIIYIIVMIFNIYTTTRFKLIDLLYAKNKNEKIRIKNGWLIFIIFIISIVLIGYAYKLLYDGSLTEGGTIFWQMLLLGAVGTFLFFLSVSGFLLKVVSWRKKTYYNGLNMFVLKQFNNRINTHVVSTTVISLMLLLTIGILSSSLSMANAMNSSFSNNTPYDFTLGSERDIDKLRQDSRYQEIIDRDYSYHTYSIDEVTLSDFISKNSDLANNIEMLEHSTMPVIKQSDFNNLMELANKDDQKVELSDNQYQLVSTLSMSLQYYNQFLEDDGKIEISGLTLNSITDKVLELSVENSNGNEGFIVVSDATAAKYGQALSYPKLAGNYQGDKEASEKKMKALLNEFNDPDPVLFGNTKIELSAEGIGTSAIFTFLGLYLGIVFAIASGTVLAIEQLSEAADNKERYRILNQLGADKIMINRSLLIQIGITFMFPLAIALIHSFVALKEINYLISLIVRINLADNIIITTLFMVIAYGGYYLATYLASNQIINE